MDVPDGGFATAEVSFLASGADPNLGQALEIRLLSNGPQTNFDNVRLLAQRQGSTVIPEPHAAVRFSLSASMLLGHRRWRR